jgi:hypothetical protein
VGLFKKKQSFHVCSECVFSDVYGFMLVSMNADFCYCFSLLIFNTYQEMGEQEKVDMALTGLMFDERWVVMAWRM